MDACLLVSLPSSCLSSEYFQYLLSVLVYFKYTTSLLAHCFALLLSILNANRKIRKRTDTDVAFTREYSRVSIFHRERESTN